MIEMKKGTALFRIWLWIWLAALSGSRLFLLFSNESRITDRAGYFEKAMIQEGAMQPVLEFPLAIAYQSSLRGIFLFVGNRIEAVPVYHSILQVVAFLLLVLGCRRLLGKAAAFAAGMVLLVLPGLSAGIYLVSPENFYLLLGAVFFYALCCLLQRLLGKTVAELIAEKRAVAGAEVPAEKQTVAGAEVSEEKQTVTGTEVSAEKPSTVRYLENPLPLPKKHRSRKMDFRITAEEGHSRTEAEDDFDFPVKEGDDFDF